MGRYHVHVTCVAEAPGCQGRPWALVCDQPLHGDCCVRETEVRPDLSYSRKGIATDSIITVYG